MPRIEPGECTAVLLAAGVGRRLGDSHDGPKVLLDFAGLYAALITALMVKAVLRDGEWAWHASSVEARDMIAFAYLVTVLLFARSSMYGDRAERPGMPRIVSSLFQVTLVALAAQSVIVELCFGTLW